jgi:hypothetical protein
MLFVYLTLPFQLLKTEAKQSDPLYYCKKEVNLKKNTRVPLTPQRKYSFSIKNFDTSMLL